MHHRSVDHTGQNGVHPDVLICEIDRRCFRQASKGPFTGCVGMRSTTGTYSVDRRDVHDRAAAGPPHEPAGRLDTEEGSGEICSNDTLKLLERGVGYPVERDDAGVVHQNVESTEAPFALGHHADPCRLVGDIQMVIGSLAADLGGQVLSLGIEDVADHHRSACHRERTCLSGSLATGSTGDNDYFALEFADGRVFFQPALAEAPFAASAAGTGSIAVRFAASPRSRRATSSWTSGMRWRP